MYIVLSVLKVLHSEKDLGLFYTVNPDDIKKISPFGKSLPLQFREEVIKKILILVFINNNFCFIV